MTDLRVIVLGSSGYDDWMSLTAALDALFDQAPPDGNLVVLAGREGSEGPEGIARTWAQEMIRDGMPVILEDIPDEPEAARPDLGLVAVLPGDPDAGVSAMLVRLSLALVGSGVRLQMIVQGPARGLPADLAGGQVLGQVTRRSLRASSRPTSRSRRGSGPLHRGH